jgi:hypothetical protein
MKHLHIGNTRLPDALVSEASAEEAHAQLSAQRERLRELGRSECSPVVRAGVLVEMARNLVSLGRPEEGWDAAREAFGAYLDAGDYGHAVEACDVLFGAEQPGSLSALGQGIWLAVTYPVDPELTVMMLDHLVEETPDDSVGGAVAAAAAAYVVELRTAGDQARTLRFFANQMLGRVAQRHGGVETQEQFQAWFERLELGDPERFLPRLRNVVDVLVQDDWWFDREALQRGIPVN